MALVLSRKNQEEIVIGEAGPDQVIVKVLGWGYQRKRIKLGIVAGQHVRVLRGEVAGIAGRERK